MSGRRIVVLGPVEVERIPNLPTLVEDLDGEVRVIRGDWWVGRCRTCQRHSTEDHAEAFRTATAAARWAAQHGGLDVSTPVDRVCPDRQAEFRVRAAFAALTGGAAA